MHMELQYADLEERYRSRVLYAQSPEERSGYEDELEGAQQVGAGRAGANASWSASLPAGPAVRARLLVVVVLLLLVLLLQARTRKA
jgi:hypothetical protein